MPSPGRPNTVSTPQSARRSHSSSDAIFAIPPDYPARGPEETRAGGYVAGVRRAIEGFHQDEDGDWVAELSCLPGQNVRHRPPFQDRAWVLPEAGRAERLGGPIDCPLCDRAELPD